MSKRRLNEPAAVRFRGNVSTIGGRLLLENAVINASSIQPAMLAWRGSFRLPGRSAGRPAVGDKLRLTRGTRRPATLVVTALVGPAVHFRVRGKLPEPD